MSISGVSASKLANPLVRGGGAVAPRPAYFKALSNAGIAALTSTQIGAMQSVEMAALSPSQIAAFNPQALSSGLLTYLSNKQDLPGKFVAGLDSTHISKFNASLVNVTLSQMSATQAGSINPSLISGIGTTVLKSLTGAQLSGFTKSQVSQLSNTQVAALQPAQISKVSDGWLNKLSNDQLQSLGAASIAALTTAQITGLGSHISDLSGSQVASLSKAQVGALAFNQIAALDTADIRAMTADQFGSLNADQLQALTIGQMAAVDGAKASAINAKSIGSMTYQQIAALNTPTVARLTGAQLAALTAEQISKGLDAAKIGALSAQKKFQSFTNNQLQAMTSAEVGAISLDALKNLPAKQLSSFTSDQFSNFSKENINWLAANAKPAGGFSKQQITAILQAKIDLNSVAYAVADQKATEGTSFSFAVPSTTFADLGGAGSRTYTSTRVDGSALPTWLQFNASTLTFSGTPANGDKGDIQLKVTASNPQGTTVSGAFKLSVLATGPSNEWTKLLPNGRVQAITTGADGSIFMAGRTSIGLNGETSIANNGCSDAFITKYDSGGNAQWTKLMGTTNNDVAFALTTGTDGYLYVAGYAGGGVNNSGGSMDGQTLIGGEDAFISKFDPQNGEKKWTHLLGTSGDDRAYGLTAGVDGAIYVSGYTPGLPLEQGLQGNHDSFVTKFQPDGTQQWTRLLGTPGDGGTSNYASNQGITTGVDGSIYVGGWTYGPDFDKTSNQNDPSNWHYNGVVTKFDTNGTKQWTRSIGTSGDTGCTAICTGTDGSIYVGGSTNESLDVRANQGSYDAFITKFNPNGTKEWTTQLGGVGNDSIIAIKPGPDGSVYVSGITSSAPSDQNTPRDIVIAKVNSDGALGWKQVKFIGTSGDDRAAGLTISDDGSTLYLGGYTTGGLNGETIVASSTGGRQPFIAKYSIDNIT